MSLFIFELNDNVMISCSREKGEVISRCDSCSAENEYRIRYKAADGRAVDHWWSESALEVCDK